MKQSLGKRIAEYRKSKKLTQDQLAEQLGITAQAVSKWENDQSCPDITVLPKLAEIFGISVDTLLGAEHSPVRPAEVVDDDFEKKNGFRYRDGKWELHYDSGRKAAIGFALWVLLVGVLLLASHILEWDIGLWGIAWPTAMVMFGLFAGKGFSFLRFGFVVFGAYFLLQNLNVPYLNLGNELIWPAVIILFGLALLADALRKPKKPKFTVTHGDQEHHSRCECHNGSNNFDCTLCFGENTHLVSTACLEHGSASVYFGELTVDLTGCDHIGDNCHIRAECSFGELIFFVPKHFRVETNADTSFASIDFEGEPCTEPVGVIHMDSSVSFGQIEIRYI